MSHRIARWPRADMISSTSDSIDREGDQKDETDPAPGAVFASASEGVNPRPHRLPCTTRSTRLAVPLGALQACFPVLS